MIASGFPVLIEKGSYMQEVSGRLSWMGHYNIVNGYDDEKQNGRCRILTIHRIIGSVMNCCSGVVVV
jgi:hypothetical protein